MAKEVSHEPHGFWKFWWLCIREAWTESWEKFGLIIDIVLWLAAALWVVFVWFSKNHPKFNVGKENELVNYWFAVIPAGLWVLWFLYHFPKAAHKIYKEEVQTSEEKHQAEIEEKNAEINRLDCEIKTFKNQHTPLEIEAVSTVAALSAGFNPDQRILIMKNNLNDCNFEIHNPNPMQAIGGVKLRLLNVEPHMENAMIVAKQQFVEHFVGGTTVPTEKSPSLDSTDYCNFNNFEFPIADLNGGQRRRTRIFTAERYGYGIVVKFDCVWRSTMANEFAPNGQHVLTLEVAGAGLQTQISRFKLCFFSNPQKIPDGYTPDSTKSKEPVFTVEKIYVPHTNK